LLFLKLKNKEKVSEAKNNFYFFKNKIKRITKIKIIASENFLFYFVIFKLKNKTCPGKIIGRLPFLFFILSISLFCQKLNSTKYIFFKKAEIHKFFSF
jgi:hypothetical protein